MVDINLANIRKLDLNLLAAFQALYEERSVTGAARRLYVGQPAMSLSLARLREAFADELFVRVGQRMEPTARAQELAPLIAQALALVDAALAAPRGFDPQSAEITFRLGVVEGIELALVPPLVLRLEAEAPRARLAVRTLGPAEAAPLLERHEIELAVTVTGMGPSWKTSEALLASSFLAVFDRRQLPLEVPLSLEDYLAHPHVLMSASGDFEGVVDEALEKLGRSRRVNFVASRFSTLAQVLRQSKRIATMPSLPAQAYAQCFGLATSPLPFPMEGFSYQMLWHPRVDNDPAQRWLREQVRALAAALGKGEILSSAV